jgi:hypothetical protein
MDPTPKGSMNRISYKGVPMWCNEEGELYFFDHLNPAERSKIGTMKDGLFPDWKEQLSAMLTSFRDTLPKRLRKPEKVEKYSRKSAKHGA